MLKTKSKIQTLLLTLSLFSFVFVSIFGIMCMNMNKDGDMTPCPFGGNSICQITNIFTVNPTEVASYFLVFLFLAVLTLSTIYFVNFSSEYLSNLLKLYERHKKHLFSFNNLQLAYATGIINSKVF